MVVMLHVARVLCLVVDPAHLLLLYLIVVRKEVVSSILVKAGFLYVFWGLWRKA